MADFGLSRKITNSSDSTDVFGVVPYVDPKYFKNKNKNQHYVLNSKSDVYSIGVLLWQISSGHRPFYDENLEYDVNLIIKIIEGKRENIAKDTPIEYSNLYEGKYQYAVYLYLII